VARREGGDQRRQVAPPEGHRSGDAQQPAWSPLQARHRAFRILGLLGDARATRVELGSDLGQVHGSRGSMQELCPDALLQGGDLLAHRGPRLAQGLGSRREAPGLHDLRKQHHVSCLDHPEVRPWLDCQSGRNRM
jgi:hypothetical protein